MNVEPYLLLGGVEIANAMRTLTYLRRGLAGAGFYVGVQSPLVVAEGGGYSDIYSDEYDYYLDSFRTENLRCYCRTIDTGPYQDPAYDGAPWYDAARPESAEFLGMLVEPVLQPTAVRGVTRRAYGGGSVGALSLSPRVVAVTGVLYAGSKAGMSYGERWLRRVLAGSSGCAEDTLVILPACAPDDVDDDTSYLRELAGVGVIDGPLFDPVTTGVADCIAQTVSLQLAAGDPYLRSTATVFEETMDGTEQCATLVASAAAADVAAVITLYASTAEMDGVVVRYRVDGGDWASVTVEDLPELATLVIDASRRRVEVHDLTGDVIGGLDSVSFDGTFPWATAEPGSEIEVCVDSTDHDYSPTATIRIDQVDREL